MKENSMIKGMEEEVNIERLFTLPHASLVTLDPAQFQMSISSLPSSQLMREAFISESFAVISAAQIEHIALTGGPNTYGHELFGFRPNFSGRRCILPCNYSEIKTYLDVKGCGVPKDVRPEADIKKNGLLLLGIALEEFIKSKIIDLCFIHGGAPYRCLPHIAVLNANFDLKHNKENFPAGILVREYHKRFPMSDLPIGYSTGHRNILEIELFLRCYGITSVSR